MSDVPQEAVTSYEWLVAYMDAGFTREEAIRILCRPHVTITQQPQYPPELFEFWERQNSFATKALQELEDE